MEKTLDTPLIEGDEVVAVEMDAPGPAALAPAQVTQFCHPLILCIWLLTVWADEGRVAAEIMNSAIARMETLLVVLFTVTTFTPGDFLCRAISNGEVEPNDASTLLQPFSACRARNQKSRTTR
ncbi:MAG TPA: hypothetical protein VGJ30_12760 [Candidatus Angelobacter sp.]|jgi:hypothetical protein